jgi:hypothetical protein
LGSPTTSTYPFPFAFPIHNRSAATVLFYFSPPKSKTVIPPLRMALPVVVDAEYLKEIEKARRDLRALIANRNCAPIMLRLA